MVKLTVWVAEPHTYEMDDKQFEQLKLGAEQLAMQGHSRNYDWAKSAIEQTFGAGFFGNAVITGIYDEDCNPIGIG